MKETEEVAAEGGKAKSSEREQHKLIHARLAALHGFFSMVDVGIGAFVRGESFPAEDLQKVVSLSAGARRSS